MARPIEMSKTQIDRLGDRLRKGDIGEGDLRLLDSYRRSFTEAYEEVVGQIRSQLDLEPTGRPAKSTASISEKLRRESVRMSQMQDIAGCRITVDDIVGQNKVVSQLTTLFDSPAMVDRRKHPSHGYRAVHLIVNSGGKLIEIQVRSSLQHLWAELSEKFSDIVNAAIKYGGGDERAVESLARISRLIALVETQEELIAEEQVWPDDFIVQTERDLINMKQLLVELLDETRDNIQGMEE